LTVREAGTTTTRPGTTEGVIRERLDEVLREVTMRGRIPVRSSLAVVTIAVAGVVGWAQQSAPIRPRPRLEPAHAPAVSVAPARVVVSETARPSPLHLVGPQAIPTRPPGGFGIVSSGTGGGGIFRDADEGSDEAEAWLGSSGYGIEAFGAVAGGYFKDSVTGQLGWAKLGFGQYGISAFGITGGSFSGAGVGVEATAGSGIGGSFTGVHGIEAYGSEYGGYFKDSTPGQLGWAKLGFGQYGISASGMAGGSFSGLAVGVQGLGDIGSSGTGGFFTGWHGVEAYGSEYGGYFKDSTPSETGWAKLGFGNIGGSFSGSYAAVQGVGDIATSGIGGYFSGWFGVIAYGTGWGDAISGHANGTGYGIRGTSVSGTGGYFNGPVKGIEAAGGSGYGGYFSGNTGVAAYGQTAGYFASNSAEGSGITATAPGGGSGTGGVFEGFYGVMAYGNRWGDALYGYANGTGRGIHAVSASGTAGSFSGINGLTAFGSQFGYAVQGTNSSTGTYAQLGKDTYKVYGTGSVSFVQNHPYDRGAVIVYSAPEGDEVATYTRGTARLVNGEARVSLGESFAWVTNPDLGLTVYLTPTGSWSDLYVSEKSTSAIVVRSAGGAPDAAFDYIVWGLRIGFEDVSIVRPKEREAYIPAMVNHEEIFRQHPDLRLFTSLARYRTERAQALGTETKDLDLSASDKLKAAIGVFNPAMHTVDAEENKVAPRRIERRLAPPGEGGGAPESPPGVGIGDSGPVAGSSQVVGALIDPASDAHRRSFRAAQPELAYTVEVDETVEPGDVLIAASDRPGFMRRAAKEGDPAVVGVVAEAPGMLLGAASDSTGASTEGTQLDTTHAYLAVSGIVRCKADASYGPIRVGDLLVTSSTQGYAMAAHAPAPGTVVGKALEPLDAGTGAIKVLVMLR
jgi:hypothetical protein